MWRWTLSPCRYCWGWSFTLKHNGHSFMVFVTVFFVSGVVGWGWWNRCAAILESLYLYSCCVQLVVWYVMRQWVWSQWIWLCDWAFEVHACYGYTISPQVWWLDGEMFLPGMRRPWSQTRMCPRGVDHSAYSSDESRGARICVSCCIVGGMCVARCVYVVVRTSCQPSNCCGLGPNMAGIGHDISDNHSNAVDITLFWCISMYVLG